jgi:hypothetical protein
MIADAQRSNAISELDLAECVKVAQRAIVMLDEGRYQQAMQAAGIAAGMAQQAARRIEVAAASRSQALRVLEACK